MNCNYRSIWNDQTGTFVAVSENAKTAGKKTSSCISDASVAARFPLKALAVSLMMSFGATVYALPAGGVVAAGGASISNGAGSTTITQTTQNAAINWQSFNIGQPEAVRFVQPNSNSVALNRVMGSDPSSILGSLSANGKVFLVNPNGILFGKGAQVNVGGLVASTLNIADSDFMAGNYTFSGTGGSVLNEGYINADGGYVALLGASVSNQGVISARLGTVALAAGNAITLDLAGDGLLNVTVNEGAVNALVQNGGVILADGGKVLLTTQAAGSLLQSVVNNTGVIQAQTIENRNGTIMLMGGMQNGTVNVGGTLDASAPNGGNGGFIETSAAHVKIQDNLNITTAAAQGTTGNWLIDPPDFNIGGPNADITGSTLGASLVANNITILSGSGKSGSNGDINVNEAVTWVRDIGTTPTTLTLLAVRDVNINAAITGTRGNFVACCGRDVNVNALITTTGQTATPNSGGNVLLSAGRDVNIVRSSASALLPDKNLAGITTTSGNIEMCAAQDINLSNKFNGAALITLTNSTGNSLPPTGPVTPRGLTLIAGAGGTGPGIAGGTLNITAGTIIKVTGPDTISPVNIYYNPTSYLTPTNYSSFFATGDGGPFRQYMLVYPDGASKTYDGTTTATFTGLKGNPAGVTLVAGVGNSATFDNANPGTGKVITFSGYTLAQGPISIGGTAINYALPAPCCDAVGGKTTATITAAPTPPPEAPPPPPPPPPAPTPKPVVTTPFVTLPVETPSEETLVIVPVWMPKVVPTRTPTELLTIVPSNIPPELLTIVPIPVAPPTPIVVPTPPPVAVPVPPTPEIYVPPPRPRKQDRN